MNGWLDETAFQAVFVSRRGMIRRGSAGPSRLGPARDQEGQIRCDKSTQRGRYDRMITPGHAMANALTNPRNSAASRQLTPMRA